MAIGDELSSLNFESLIGGPLTAVIKAQMQSSVTTVDFIKAVGFDRNEAGDITQPTMISFKYEKPIEQKDANGNVTIVATPYTLTVPFLTMLPIPFIRIDEVSIDFNAKITAISESSATSSTGISGELKAKAGWGWGSASLKVSASYQSSSAQSQKVDRAYSLVVHVKAVQEDMPAGTERLLGILENAIKEVPVSPSPAP